MKLFPLLRLLLVAVLCQGAARAEERVLNLLCWSEYVPASVIQGFSEASGVAVTMETYNSNEQMLAKLRAKPGAYDVIQPSGFYVETLAKARELHPLDFSRIPNAANLDPKFRALPHDPGCHYSVPWLAGTIGIVVNTERIKEPVNEWADVFSGKYAGRIVIVEDGREMVAWSLAAEGLPITDVSDAALAKVKPTLAKWLRQVKVFDSDSPHKALLDGSADIGIMWSGEAALLWQKDHKYRYLVPEHGAHMFVDSLAIPERSPHKALAEDFINYCLAPHVSVSISNAYPYTNPNLAARRLLTPEQLANPASYPTDERQLAPLRNTGNTTAAVEAFVKSIRHSLGGTRRLR